MRFGFWMGSPGVISTLAVSEPGAEGTVSITDPSPLYDGVETTVTVTATGDVDRVVLAVVDGAEVWDDSSAPFSGAWTPGASGTITLRATGYAGAAVVATDDIEVEVGTYAEGLAADFAAIGTSGASQLLWALPASSLSEFEQDLTGNEQHATEATETPDYVDPGAGADPYIQFTGANNDHLHIPYTWANNATAWTVAFSFRSAGAGTYNAVLNIGTSTTIVYGGIFYGGILWVTVNGVQGYVDAVTANTDHTVVLSYDASRSQSERVRCYIDDELRQWAVPVAWPTSLPASHSQGRVGNRYADDQDFTGRVHFLAQWYTEGLDSTGVAAIFTACRNYLTYTSAWVPTGTSFSEHTLAAAAIDPTPIALTATGYTVTPDTPVTVFDHGGPHVGFTDIRTVAADSYQVVFRHGAGHVDLTGAIQLVTSTGGYAEEDWAAPAGLVDTTGEDDRDPRFATLGGVASVLYSREPVPGEFGQVYSIAVAGGGSTSVFGYPCIPGAQKQTFQGWQAGDLIGAYGGPTSLSGWLCVLVGGTDIYWTPAALDGANQVLLYEPHAILLSEANGGGYLCACRTGYPGSASWAPVLLRSTDGMSWTECRRFPATAGDTDTLYIDSPFLFEMSTGVIVMVGRRRLIADVVLLYSADGGDTWSEPVTLLVGDGGYGGYCGVVEVSPTLLLVSYYAEISYKIGVVPVMIEADA